MALCLLMRRLRLACSDEDWLNAGKDMMRELENLRVIRRGGSFAQSSTSNFFISFGHATSPHSRPDNAYSRPECPVYPGLDRFRADSVLFLAGTQWFQSLSCRHQDVFGIVFWDKYLVTWSCMRGVNIEFTSRTLENGVEYPAWVSQWTILWRVMKHTVGFSLSALRHSR